MSKTNITNGTGFYSETTKLSDAIIHISSLDLDGISVYKELQLQAGKKVDVESGVYKVITAINNVFHNGKIRPFGTLLSVLDNNATDREGIYKKFNVIIPADLPDLSSVNIYLLILNSCEDADVAQRIFRLIIR